LPEFPIDDSGSTTESSQNLGDKLRALENQPGVELNETGPGIDLLQRILPAGNAAHPYDGDSAVQQLSETPDDRRRTIPQQSTAQAARLLEKWEVPGEISRQGRVGGDHTIYSVLDQEHRNIPQLLRIEIRRDFQGNRNVPGAFAGKARLLGFEGGEQALEFSVALQLSQVFRIRGGDVHGDVSGTIVNRSQAGNVFFSRVFQRSVEILPDVNAHHTPVSSPSDVFHKRVHTDVIEPHPIDDRGGGPDPEQARLRISRLRSQGDGSNLYKPEPECAQSINTGPIFVHPRRQADRIRETQTHDFGGCASDSLPGKDRGEADTVHGIERSKREFVGGLRTELKEQRPNQAVEHSRILTQCP
jgi:hypothetical protein